MVGRLRASELRLQRILQRKLVRRPEVLQESAILTACQKTVSIASVHNGVAQRAGEWCVLHDDVLAGERLACSSAKRLVENVQRDLIDRLIAGSA